MFLWVNSSLSPRSRKLVLIPFSLSSLLVSPAAPVSQESLWHGFLLRAVQRMDSFQFSSQTRTLETKNCLKLTEVLCSTRTIASYFGRIGAGYTECRKTAAATAMMLTLSPLPPNYTWNDTVKVSIWQQLLEGRLSSCWPHSRGGVEWGWGRDSCLWSVWSQPSPWLSPLQA